LDTISTNNVQFFARSSTTICPAPKLDMKIVVIGGGVVRILNMLSTITSLGVGPC